MDKDRLRACASEDLVRSATQLGAALAATHSALLEILAVIDERQLWRPDGCCSMVDWVSFRLGVTRKTAHEWVDGARALTELPCLAKAFASGELSWDKTKAVSTMADPDSEESLVEEAKAADIRHLEIASRRARAVSLQEAKERQQARFFSIRRSVAAGGVRLAGFLPDVDGETLIKAVERLADDVPKDPDTGIYPRFDERCADALVDLAASFLSGEQARHGERAMVVTHVDVSAVPGHGIHAECESGMTLAPETAARLMCDALIEPVFEQDGRKVAEGKRHRFPPGRMRRELVHRDVMCRFPGCTRSALLHAHHVKHWPKGPTQPDNLLMLCRYHHKMVHEGAWTILGNPEGTVEFVKPNGERLVSNVPRLSEEVRKRILGPVLPDG